MDGISVAFTCDFEDYPDGYGEITSMAIHINGKDIKLVGTLELWPNQELFSQGIPSRASKLIAIPIDLDSSNYYDLLYQEMQQPSKEKESIRGPENVKINLTTATRVSSSTEK